LFKSNTSSSNYKVIIPARKNSKRYPRKNIQLLNGIPLIAHSIEFALKSFSNDKIWVNTDDESIWEIARDYRVQLTERPTDLARDNTSTAEVLFFQDAFFTKNKVEYDSMILLQPTNPLRPDGLIEGAINLFESNKRQSLASFSILNRKYGKIKSDYFFPENYKPGQRIQDIEPDYFENGLIYITCKEAIRNSVIITPDVLPFIISDIESSVDIDEPHDMIFAEFLLNKRK
jgi:CMP-N-acetylneuraminic acid synthetase